jgi:hypothetical protein
MSMLWISSLSLKYLQKKVIFAKDHPDQATARQPRYGDTQGMFVMSATWQLMPKVEAMGSVGAAVPLRCAFLT